jgi:hypothetical protein
MLFMVIERFKNGNPAPLGERFAQSGRMLPEDLTYHASWIDAVGARCFQIMECSGRESLDAWIRKWDDVADFEVIPVVTSAEFWQQPGDTRS